LSTARSKGSSDSSMAMVFDKIEVSKGNEIPIKGTLQAIAPSLATSAPDTGGPSGVSLGGHSGSGADAGTTPAPTASSSFPATPSKPIVNSQSQGVLGVRNLEMDKNGVITSTGKEVKLDSGTQMLVRVDIPVPVQ
jgi:hypothetical protein